MKTKNKKIIFNLLFHQAGQEVPEFLQKYSDGDSTGFNRGGRNTDVK